ncbi:hypothetical protein ACT3SP_18240 [Brachybacterium sp. AOP43-C2-M15]|uniref:hypothetical protein n=1 Tax=Brachybacterium sp. AOP43-C2-M15 TaxID=3457661 RepID=UPI0040337E42
MSSRPDDADDLQAPAPGPASAPGPRAEPVTAPAGQPPRNGTIAWAIGFLAYLPVPVLGLIVAGVAQLVVGLGQRKHGGLAAVNGVRAANWGLTQLCWPVLMAVTVLIGVLTGSPGASGGVSFHPAMEVVTFTMLGLFFVVALLEAVYAIVGTVMASTGRRVPLPVIPFLRTPRR